MVKQTEVLPTDICVEIRVEIDLGRTLEGPKHKCDKIPFECPAGRIVTEKLVRRAGSNSGKLEKLASLISEAEGAKPPH